MRGIASPAREAIECKRDQLVKQRGIRHARCLPELWIHRYWCEARNGIYLVAEKPAPVFFVKEVDASHAFGSERVENHYC